MKNNKDIIKYSPTVKAWYHIDKYWFKNNCFNKNDIYDKDGFNKYGFNKDNIDRNNLTLLDYFEKSYTNEEKITIYPLYEQISQEYLNYLIPNIQDKKYQELIQNIELIKKELDILNVYIKKFNNIKVSLLETLYDSENEIDLSLITFLKKNIYSFDIQYYIIEHYDQDIINQLKLIKNQKNTMYNIYIIIENIVLNSELNTYISNYEYKKIFIEHQFDLFIIKNEHFKKWIESIEKNILNISYNQKEEETLEEIKERNKYLEKIIQDLSKNNSNISLIYKLFNKIEKIKKENKKLTQELEKVNHKNNEIEH